MPNLHEPFVADGDSAVVWKYPLDLTSRNGLPDGAAVIRTCGRVVHVALDPKLQWCAWVLIEDPDRPVHDEVVLVRGTGHPLPDGVWAYLNTVHAGAFMWHGFVGVLAAGGDLS